MRKVQTFINGCLRRILKIKWQDRVKNDDIWERTQQRPIVEEIKTRRWRWIGHTLRKPAHSTTRQALQWNPQGSRRRGRPRETWKRCIERDMKQMGHGWSELGRMAQDKRRWKSLIRGLYPDKGDRLWWWWWLCYYLALHWGDRQWSVCMHNVYRWCYLYSHL